MKTDQELIEEVEMRNLELKKSLDQFINDLPYDCEGHPREDQEIEARKVEIEKAREQSRKAQEEYVLDCEGWLQDDEDLHFFLS